MGSKGVVWRPIATIAAAVGDVELEDQVLRLSRYLGYTKVLLNIFYFLGGGPALKKKHGGPCMMLARYRGGGGWRVHVS